MKEFINTDEIKRFQTFPALSYRDISVIILMWNIWWYVASFRPCILSLLLTHPKIPRHFLLLKKRASGQWGHPLSTLSSPLSARTVSSKKSVRILSGLTLDSNPITFIGILGQSHFCLDFLSQLTFGQSLTKIWETSEEEKTVPFLALHRILLPPKVNRDKAKRRKLCSQKSSRFHQFFNCYQLKSKPNYGEPVTTRARPSTWHFSTSYKKKVLRKHDQLFFSDMIASDDNESVRRRRYWQHGELNGVM